MTPELPDLADVQQRLADEILEIHRESYGKGAAEARCHIHGDEVIVTLDRIEFLPNETFLIAQGREQLVLQTRSEYQKAVGDIFIAAVERATGRRVTASNSLTNLDRPTWSSTSGSPTQSEEVMETSSGNPAPARHSAALSISNGLVGLVARYAGRGPTKTRTTVNTNFVLSVFKDVLSKPEQHMLDRGRSAAVIRMREEVFELMRDEAVELVESELGRQVVSYLGDFDPTADVAVTVFVLDPVEEDGITATAEAG